MSKPKTLIVIAGPTAIGKTALSIEVAQHYQTEIISADSRQFFKEMSIGTAKPNTQELAAAPHHFINSHSINQEVSVGTFEKEAIQKIEELFQKHDVLVMVGGSGLYVNAVLYGFDEIPKADESIRNKLNQQFIEEGIETLQQQLLELDPVYYNEVDIRNPHRVIRALEVCMCSGKPYSSFRKTENKARNFEVTLIGLDIEREKLYEKINHRVDLMMEEGLLEEVKSLQEHQHLNALKTVGYTELFKYLNNECSLPEAVEKIKQNTRNFAKRQLTWFRKNEELIWFEPDFTTIIAFLDQKRLYTFKLL
jgi:tRNA dimethylallyltransferase